MVTRRLLGGSGLSMTGLLSTALTMMLFSATIEIVALVYVFRALLEVWFSGSSVCRSQLGSVAGSLHGALVGSHWVHVMLDLNFQKLFSV